MDETLKLKAEQLASDIATQAQTLDDLNGLIRNLMKSALERMLNTEMDVHLGRRSLPTVADATLPATEAISAEPATPPAQRVPIEERKVITVLFCDLVGFTARSDESDPEHVRAQLRPGQAAINPPLDSLRLFVP